MLKALDPIPDARSFEDPPKPGPDAWGPGRCHSCELCAQLNDCPDSCGKTPERLKEVSNTFTALWTAMEQHASETLIAFVVKYASFEGKSKLDLR